MSDKPKVKKIYVREYWFDNFLDKNQDFNWSAKPIAGYVPVTIMKGHGDIVQIGTDTKPEVKMDMNTLPIKTRWKIRHKMSGFETVTLEEYASFNESISEYIDGRNFKYTNYEPVCRLVEVDN